MVINRRRITTTKTPMMKMMSMETPFKMNKRSRFNIMKIICAKELRGVEMETTLAPAKPAAEKPITTKVMVQNQVMTTTKGTKTSINMRSNNFRKIR